mmetsp:Transcript_14800/g.42009  ORF Transcript_14800/g.42009 Transcript_14800/m.42009 type:complete len:203 (-) Transcript_14800:96-704(-)
MAWNAAPRSTNSSGSPRQNSLCSAWRARRRPSANASTPPCWRGTARSPRRRPSPPCWGATILIMSRRRRNENSTASSCRKCAWRTYNRARRTPPSSPGRSTPGSTRSIGSFRTRGTTRPMPSIARCRPPDLSSLRPINESLWRGSTNFASTRRVSQTVSCVSRSSSRAANSSTYSVGPRSWSGCGACWRFLCISRWAVASMT